MTSAVSRCATVLALLGVSVVAQAQPFTVGVLPSRRDDVAALRARVLRLGATVGGVAAAPPFSLAPLVGRADELSAAGRLDEAAALYDLAVEQGSRAPLAVDDPAALVHALVARASIGLARGEAAQATTLLGRALRWDPTLTLTAAENTPRVAAAWARVRAAAGATPALGRGDFGADCGHLLVARALADGTVELSRVEGCRSEARAIAAADVPDAVVVAQLGASLAVAPPPSKPRTPTYKRAWVWVTLGLGAALLAGGAVTAWALTRPTDGSWNVTPRF